MDEGKQLLASDHKKYYGMIVGNWWIMQFYHGYIFEATYIIW